MAAILAAFDPLDRIFLLSSLIGGVLFIVISLLSMLGHHSDADGLDIAGGDTSVTDAMLSHEVGADGGQPAFRLLSVRGIISFFVVFGLTGLSLHRGNQLGPGISILGAFVAGLAMMAVLAKIMQIMLGLQSTGNLDIAKAVGAVGTVYLHIPEGGGTGQVQVDVANRRMVVDAASEDKTAMATGDRVEVTRVLSDGTLIVRKL